MSEDTTGRRRTRATDDGSVDAPGGPDRRSVLRRSAAAAATLGAPLLGACTETAGPGAPATDSPSSEAAAMVAEHAREDAVAEAIGANEALFATLADLGFPGAGPSEGLRVTAYRMDGELRPEQRLYRATDVGVLTLVVSPEGSPFGPHADVVTSPAMMDRADFEWPDERVSELPDGRRVFRVDGDGWTEPGFGNPVEVEDVPVVERLCGSGSADPRDWECTGPTGNEGCAYVTCCGHVEITDPGDCPDVGGGATNRYDLCEALENECGETCWRTSSGCRCVTFPGFDC